VQHTPTQSSSTSAMSPNSASSISTLHATSGVTSTPTHQKEVGNRFITYHRFMVFLTQHDLGLSKTAMFDYVRKLDKKKDGKIDYDEFLSTFEIYYQRTVRPADHVWITAELCKIAKAVKGPLTLRELLKKSHKTVHQPTHDTDEEKYKCLKFKAFNRLLQQLDVCSNLTDLQRRKLFAYLDITKHDVVHFEDLEKSLFSPFPNSLLPPPSPSSPTSAHLSSYSHTSASPSHSPSANALSKHISHINDKEHTNSQVT